MVCRISRPTALDGDVVLVGHNPPSVFTITSTQLSQMKVKPDGHYNRDDLMDLVKQGSAVLYDEKALRAIAQATEVLIHGCPPAP